MKKCDIYNILSIKRGTCIKIYVSRKRLLTLLKKKKKKSNEKLRKLNLIYLI